MTAMQSVLEQRLSALPLNRRRRRIVRVLCFGWAPTNRVGPLGDLAEALKRENLAPTLVCKTPTLKQWFRLVLLHDSLILLSFGLSWRDQFFLATAAALGCRVIRWWIGSDVSDCLQDCDERSQALKANRVIVQNVAVADHLAEELRTIGINARRIPSFINSLLPERLEPHGRLTRDILVYLPTTKAEFYGERVVREIAGRNPDLHFVIVGDEDAGRFAGLSNVESLGLVRDMKLVYERVGCLLRITRHDGLPCMVLESLLQGKYVIYSWPLPGCWLAKTADEVHARLAEFRKQSEINQDGVAQARMLLNPSPARQFSDLIEELIGKWSVSNRLAGAGAIVRLTLERLMRTEPKVQPALGGTGMQSKSESD